MKKQDISPSAITAGYLKRQRRYILTTGILLLLTLALAAVMMLYGNTIYSPETVLRVLSGTDAGGAAFTIRTLRFPRMLTAILCGMAFGLSGNTFQQLLGNPLASPDIIGVTSGASVAAVFGILILKLDYGIVAVMAVFSGLLVSALIYFLSHKNGFSNTRLILTGIGMQAFLNSIISWMLLKASEYDVASALRWLSGSLNGVKMDTVPALAAVVFTAGLGILLLSRHLLILQLGEAHAVTLGIPVSITRLLLILLALVLTAFAASVTGPIASVAFLSGPIAARISGRGRSNMLAASLTGSILILISDLVGQFTLPSRYPVGVITGILGAPYLLFLLLRINHKGD
ncbi:MAG: iron ABC transporter permease [Lachnospiraceae bacterium]|nr:iron ABC transporter permease [Lachnospiraceae bacterium]